jgi:hypothetical protein
VLPEAGIVVAVTSSDALGAADDAAATPVNNPAMRAKTVTALAIERMRPAPLVVVPGHSPGNPSMSTP